MCRDSIQSQNKDSNATLMEIPASISFLLILGECFLKDIYLLSGMMTTYL